VFNFSLPLSILFRLFSSVNIAVDQYEVKIFARLPLLQWVIDKMGFIAFKTLLQSVFGFR